MQRNGKTEKGATPSEVRIWAAALTGAVGGCFVAVLFDVYEGEPLQRMIPWRASVALGCLLGWGGHHLISRRAQDIWVFIGLMGTVGAGRAHGSILSGVLVSAVIAFLASLFGGAIVRSLENARAKDDAEAKGKLPRSDHPMFDSELVC